MRLVLDTNVWLDWLVFGDAQIAPLKALREAGGAQIVTDAACMEELRRVLGYTLRKTVLDEAAQAAALAACRALATMHDSVAQPPGGTPLPLCRDPDDQKFLLLARAARADILITKDRALLELARRKYAHIGFRILTPAGFNAWLAQHAAATVAGAP
jgi:putative PIN family toxin of toxin-antitoxin system